MKSVLETNSEYISLVDPPAADPRVAHPNRDGSVYQGQGLIIDAEQLSMDSGQSGLKEEPAVYEVSTQEEKSADTSDYGLYKCQGCGTMVMGFAKDEHVESVHGGESQGFEML
jgi:hypothetical protein